MIFYFVLFKFVAIVDFDKTSGQKTAGELQIKYGPERVHFIPCDVSSVEQLEGKMR